MLRTLRIDDDGGRVPRAFWGAVQDDATRQQRRDWLATVLPAFRGGEDTAYAAIFSAYTPLLIRYIETMLRREDARDVAQQALTDVYARRATASDTAAGFEHWLFMIARHRAIDLIRKLRRLEIAAPHELDEARERRRATEFDTDINVSALMQALSHGQREVVALRYLYCCSTEEIARATSSTGAAVRQAEHRSLAKLRSGLATTSPAPGLAAPRHQDVAQ